MSAPNFNCRANSKYIYAFCMWQDFDEYKEDLKKNDPEYWEEMKDYYEGDNSYWDWSEDETYFYMECLNEDLKEFANGHEGMQIKFNGWSRNDANTEIATVSKRFKFGGQEWFTTLSIDIEYGYYCGWALDWNVKEIIDGWTDCGIEDMEDEELAECLRDFSYTNNCYYGLNAGMAKILAPRFRNRIKAVVREIADVIEQALQKTAPHCLGGFCLGNGEGIYFEKKQEIA